MPHPPTGDNAPATGDEVSLVTVTGPLTQAQAASVLPLAEAATERDSVGPLSEHVLLHLRYGGDAQARNLLLTAGPGAGWLRAPGSRRSGRGPGRGTRHPPGLPRPRARAHPGPRAAGRGGPAAAAGLGPRRPARGRRPGGPGRVRADPVTVDDAAPAGRPAAGPGLPRRGHTAHVFRRRGRGGLAGPQPESVRPATRSRAPGQPRTCPCGNASPGSTRPGSSWPSDPGNWPASTGPRSTPGQKTRTRPGSVMNPRARRASARCTSSAWIPPSRAADWAAR